LNQNKRISLSAWLGASSSSSQKSTTTSHGTAAVAAAATVAGTTSTTNINASNPFETSDYTSLGSLPPHPYSKAGRFSGLLYTAPLSKWRRRDIVMEWPPKPSPECPLSAWNANVDGNGTLVLEQIEAYIPPHPLPSSSSAQSPKVPAAQATTNNNNNNDDDDSNKTATTLNSPRKVGIPLEGCKLELLTEGLEGRDSMSRRAPLLVTHARWNLLDGERGLYIFAPEAAAKQEWATALGWWCDGNKRRIRALEAIYSAYCLSMKKRSIIEYAHEGQLASFNGSKGGGGGGAGQEDAATPNPQKKKKRRRKRDIFKLSSPQKALLPPRPESPLQPTLLLEEDEDEEETRPSSSSSPPPLQQQQCAPTMNSKSNNATQRQPAIKPVAPQTTADLSIEAIMEARWMQSRKIPVPPALPSTKLTPASLCTTKVAGKEEVRQDGAILRPPAMPPQQQQPPLHTDGHTNNINDNNNNNNASSAHPIVKEEDCTVRAMDFPSKSNGGGSRRRTASHVEVVVAKKIPNEGEEGEKEAGAVSNSTTATTAGGGGRVVTVELLSQTDENDSRGVFGPLPQGLPPPLAIDYGANAFLTRLAFDMLRSAHFKDFITKRVRQQVSKLALPNFVQTLEVVDLNLGSTAPTIGNLASLAAPASDTIWPQLLFDLSYVGEFTIVLETKIELREARGWERLETVLEKVGGGGTKKKEGEEGEGGRVEDGSTYSSRGGSPECDDNRIGDDDDDDDDDDESSQSHSQPATPASSASKQPSLKSALFSELRKTTATKLRKWAESTATHISKYPLRIKLTLTRLEGRAVVWIPPPPGNLLFFSFLTPPRLSVKGKPEVAGRLLRYGYHVSRANSWLESQMRKALQRSMVFPGGADIHIPSILGGDAGDIDSLFPKDGYDDNADDEGDILPGLEIYLKKAAEQGGELPMGVDGAGLAEAARMVVEAMMEKKRAGGEGESGRNSAI
jgi:hypothetical protein